MPVSNMILGVYMNLFLIWSAKFISTMVEMIDQSIKFSFNYFLGCCHINWSLSNLIATQKYNFIDPIYFTVGFGGNLLLFLLKEILVRIVVCVPCVIGHRSFVLAVPYFKNFRWNSGILNSLFPIVWIRLCINERPFKFSDTFLQISTGWAT